MISFFPLIIHALVEERNYFSSGGFFIFLWKKLRYRYSRKINKTYVAIKNQIPQDVPYPRRRSNVGSFCGGEFWLRLGEETPVANCKWPAATVSLSRVFFNAEVLHIGHMLSRISTTRREPMLYIFCRFDFFNEPPSKIWLKESLLGREHWSAHSRCLFSELLPMNLRADIYCLGEFSQKVREYISSFEKTHCLLNFFQKSISGHHHDLIFDP